MLYEIMRECRNDFRIKGAEMTGTFEIAGGCIGLRNLLPGQYYLIEGSVFNDGLHQAGVDILTDETFRGAVIPLAIPKAFLELSDRVDSWREKYGEASPIISENFAGEYSYQKTVGSTGKQLTWKDAFSSDLSIWRKLDVCF